MNTFFIVICLSNAVLACLFALHLYMGLMSPAQFSRMLRVFFIRFVKGSEIVVVITMEKSTRK